MINRRKYIKNTYLRGINKYEHHIFEDKNKENHEYEGTITLTLRRLTTGVTVPEWSCVLMLNECTSAQAYFQTGFRAKSQYSHDGMIKRLASIYDFNTDRTLQIIP